MDAFTRLQTLCDTLPPEASVTVPVATLRQWLALEGDAPCADLTVTDVAEQLNRSPSTVRHWIRRGELDTYRLNGREHRITRAALGGFLERQRTQTPPTPKQRTTGDSRPNLGAWRRVRRK
jgi:excisionase family DNA binding protein